MNRTSESTISRPNARPSDQAVIGIASSGLGHVSRGIETWASDLSKALRRRGIKVHLYQGGGSPGHADDHVVSCWHRSSWPNNAVGLLPRRLTWRAGFGSSYSIEQTTFAKSLLGHLRRQPVQLIHVQDPLVARALNRAHQSGRSAAPVILGHGTEEPTEFLQQLPYVQHLAPWHLEQTPRPATAHQWSAIGNFVSTAAFSPGRSPQIRQELNIPHDAMLVLCLAAIKKTHKRIHHLIREIADVRKRAPELPIYLVIAGAEEPESASLMQKGIETLGERVRFLVNVERSRIPDLLKAADVFVLASLYEMMPIAVLEAAATGLPVVTHDHPVLRWMTGDGGIGVDMGRVGALSEVLQSLNRVPAGRSRDTA